MGVEVGTVKVLVPQLCPTLGDPMNGNQLDSSVCGIFQARIQEWLAIYSSRDQTPVFCIAGKFFFHCLSRRKEALINVTVFIKGRGLRDMNYYI